MSSLSYGYTVSSERLRVLRFTELLAFLLLIAVVCWMLFPRDLAMSLRNARLDAVTLSYMQAWLKAKPDDHQLRLLMARELIQLGRFSEADEQLELVAAETAAYQSDIAWLALVRDFTRLMAIEPADRTGTMLEFDTIERVQTVDWGALTREQREQLADMALALNETAVASDAYRRLAAQSQNPDTWYDRAAQVQLANGDYQQAARSWIMAMAARGAPEIRKGYFLSALAALEAGGFHRAALDLAARRERPFLDDSEVVFRLMMLAQAGGDMDRAQHYALILLKLPGHPGEQ